MNKVAEKEEVKVTESKTTDGKRKVTLKKEGSKETTRLDHVSPSWMRSEE